MGYIVVKTGEDVEIFEEEDFSADRDERYLHEIIEGNPWIVAREVTGRDAATLASRLRLPSGELDLLLIDSAGDLILVELKRGRGHREAVAQLLDYASDLQQMAEEELFRSSGARFSSLREVFEEFYGGEQEFGFEEFEENFRRSLRDPRRIRLLLVSYRVGEDTIRLANWLRNFGIDVLCMEFEYFKGGDKEMFVPKLLTSTEMLGEMEGCGLTRGKLHSGYGVDK